MDWFTLLLIFIFFVLPLIQQIAEARKRGQEPPEPEPGDDEEWVFEEEERIGRTPRAHAPPEVASEPRREVSDGWSSGWGSWPTEEEQVSASGGKEETSSEPRFTPVPAQRTQRDSVVVPELSTPPIRAERDAPVTRPERPVPVVRSERPVPTIRPERVLVEREVPIEPLVVERRAEPQRGRARVREMSVPVYGARRGATALGMAVHNPGELRRAILLAEVLGPPRSLRPLETERD
jgi:hypothetical protein